MITPITMPKFGLAMTEGKIAAWSKGEGDRIRVGEELADIETSKITNAYESPVAGVLRRRIAEEQIDLPVGALLGVVADPAVPDTEIDDFIARFQADFAEQAAALAASIPAPAPEPRRIEAGGRSLRVLEAGEGDGTPVIFIHGFGGDLNNFLFNQPAIAEGRRTVAIDLPGHGGSTKDVGSGERSELERAVLDAMGALGIDRAHLVGHSLGGAVALALALDHPDRVASAILLAPGGLGREIDGAFIDGFLTADKRRAMQPVLEKLVADPALITRDMIDDVLKFKRLDGAGAALAAIASANFGGGSQRGLLRERVRSAKVPVRVIWGRDDAILPAHHAEGLPGNVEVHVLDGVGHMPHMERSAEVNRKLAGWIGA